MDTKFLAGTLLFRDMTEEEISRALTMLRGRFKRFEKDEIIMMAGTTTEEMGVVLEGSVSIESNDLWGNRTILTHVSQGQFFAETYAILGNESLLVDVTASRDCHILFLRIGGIQNPASITDTWKIKLITNLLDILSHKTLLLSGRSFHTSPKTIRGKVMAYLNSLSIQHNSNEFDIPFDRQQLADYLNLERSALSKELGRMQRDGIITTRRSHFIVHTSDEI